MTTTAIPSSAPAAANRMATAAANFLDALDGGQRTTATFPFAGEERYDWAYTPIDRNGLLEFHRRRWEFLAVSGADLIACETIPSRPEAGVLLGLLRDTPDRWAWMSFSCRDGTHLSDGSRLAEAAEECEAEPRVAAVGINCTSPEFIASLIAEARKGTAKPILVYPNSGERYNARTKSWAAAPCQVNWKELSGEWARLGAAGIGGCCRVGPPQIAEIRRRLVTPA